MEKLKDKRSPKIKNEEKMTKFIQEENGWPSSSEDKPHLYQTHALETTQCSNRGYLAFFFLSELFMPAQVILLTYFASRHFLLTTP